MINGSKKAYVYIVVAVFLWSTVATAFKISLKYLTVIQFLLFSSLTSTAILFLISFKDLNRKIQKRDILHSALYGLLNPFAYYLILFEAYNLLPAQIAQPINYTWPIILTVFSVIFLGKKVSVKNYIGISISFVGATIISISGHMQFSNGVNVWGVMLAFLSAFVWAVFWIVNLNDPRKETVKLFFNFLFGTFYIFLLFFLTGSFTNIDARGIAPAIYTGMFEMGITYFLFLKALRLSNSPARISNFAYLSPFLSLFFINEVLKEKILVSTVIGLFMIVVGIMLGSLWEKQ